MTDDEDLILAQALGAVGATGGGSGGRRGAAFAARRLKKNVHEVELSLGLSPSEAAARAADVLLRLGTPVRTAGAEPPAGARVVRALVGGGFGNMNPVLVTVTLTGAGPQATAVRVRGAAKEGLIKQRAGEKTARQVAELLSRPGC
ncbi:hypothetical protein ACFV0H_02150 [Streptomyces erythrochromogenes]|uniref:Uncharacterized protein n=1 Tax=Streptomyces erythrochromogenes TaxID=285574 RepID=A0ABZ1Q4R1_9ACTN|nr:hypothetical protein [Streptomyces erythrochromogenes]MCX5583464.1 hypothetical protein [Streptomyces erythrochromogenes]